MLFLTITKHKYKLLGLLLLISLNLLALRCNPIYKCNGNCTPVPISGRVIDRQTGLPVPNVTGELFLRTTRSGILSGSLNKRVIAQFQTDENGAFRISPQIDPSDVSTSRSLLYLQLIENSQYINDPNNLIIVSDLKTANLVNIEVGVYFGADLVIEVVNSKRKDVNNLSFYYTFLPNQNITNANYFLVYDRKADGFIKDTLIVVRTAANRFTRISKKIAINGGGLARIEEADSIFCRSGVVTHYKIDY